MWWLVGIFAVWIAAAVVLAVWIGRVISRADAEEVAIKRRRAETEEKQCDR